MLAVGYLAAVLVSLRFWGSHLLRFLAPGIQSENGLAITFGLSAYLCACGYLEFFQVAGRASLLGFVAVGIVGQIAAWVRHPPSRPTLCVGPPLAVVLYALAGLALALMLVNAAEWTFAFDDREGYLVLPERILAEGSLGRDLFNYRRIEAGLGGGGGYLYALFRAALAAPQTRLADVGIGSVTMLLLVWEHARARRVGPIITPALLLLALAVIVLSPIINNTPDTVAKALLYALIRIGPLLIGRAAPDLGRAALQVLLGVALLTLKTSYLPLLAAAGAATYLVILLVPARSRLLGELAVGALVAGILMAPWMVVDWRIAGTPWYPLLGVGTLSPEEAMGTATLIRFLPDFGRLALILILPAFVGVAALSNRPHEQSDTWIAVLMGLFVILTAMSQAKYSVFGYRYGHSGAVTVFLFCSVLAPGMLPRRLLRLGAPLGVVVAIAVMAQSNPTGRHWWLDGVIGVALVGPPSYAMPVGEPAAVRATQSAIPRGAPVAAILSWPSLLDFARNPIMVMDWPGMIGPLPRPASNDAPGWAAYLKRLGIDYIAYSYADEGGYGANWIKHDLRQYSNPRSYSAFMLAQARNAQQMHATFLALEAQGKVIYDDGKCFVVRIAP